MGNIAILEKAVASYGQSAEMANFLSRIMRAESGGNALAKNPNSTASGLFQFTRSTWDDYGRGDNIYDPNAQCDAVVRFTMDNAAALKYVLGREPNTGEYYLAHFAGRYGACKILTASPSTPISDILGAGAINANAGIKFRGKRFADFNAGDLRQWAAARMDVDVDDLYQYEVLKRNGLTTKEGDEAENKKRIRILEEFGLGGDAARILASDMVRGLFIALVKLYMEESAPAAEKTIQIPTPQHDATDIVPPLQAFSRLRPPSVTAL